MKYNNKLFASKNDLWAHIALSLDYALTNQTDYIPSNSGERGLREK